MASEPCGFYSLDAEITRFVKKWKSRDLNGDPFTRLTWVHKELGYLQDRVLAWAKQDILGAEAREAVLGLALKAAVEELHKSRERDKKGA